MHEIRVRYRAHTGPDCTAEKMTRFFVHIEPHFGGESTIDEVEAFSVTGEWVRIKGLRRKEYTLWGLPTKRDGEYTADAVVWPSRAKQHREWARHWARQRKQREESTQDRQEVPPPPPPPPAPRREPERAFWRVLGLKPSVARAGSGKALDAVERAFRKLALRHHPDRPSGDAEAFKRLTKARDEAREFLQQSVP